MTNEYVQKRFLRQSACDTKFMRTNPLSFALVDNDTKIDIVQDVVAKEAREDVQTIESDRLLDETAETDVSTLIEARSIIVAESGVITSELNANIPAPKLPEKCEKIETNFLSSAFGSVTTIKSAGRKQTINARSVLWYFSFVGFAINYMMRVNVNIAITEMVTLNASKHGNHMSECIVHTFKNSTTEFARNINTTRLMVDAISAPTIPHTLEQQILDYFGVSWETGKSKRKISQFHLF